jgi:hypothetical protein
MPDITNISDQITKISGWLTETVKKLDEFGLAKSLAISEYDRALAIAQISLKYIKGSKLHTLLCKIPGVGDVVNLGAIESGGAVPATLIPKVAPGLCSEERLKVEQASVAYKALLVKIDVLQAQLNANQSLFRHLSHT